MAGAPLELIAVEVIADIDQLQRQMPASARIVDQSMTQVERSMVRAEQQAVRSSMVIGRSFDSATQRSRLLGYQISDIGTQLASGTNPFLIMAQQGPQVANALEGATGAAGRLAAFFSGPMGAALLIATSIAGGLIYKLWDTADAADGAAAAAQRLTTAMKNLGELEFDGGDLTTVQSELFKLEAEAARLERLAEQRGAGRGGGGRFYQQQAEEARAEANRLRRELERATDPRNPAALIRARNQAIFDPEPERRTRKTDAERAAEKAAREAERERERLEREAAALEKRYGKTLEQLTLERQLAELRDRGTDAARQQADILEANFRIEQQFPELAESTAMADQLRLQLLKQIAAATIEEAYGRKASQDALEAWFDAAEKRQADLAREREKADRAAARQQEEQIRTLAGLYHDAFTGGTEAIWDNFKQIGLAVIAEVLARFTISQLSGGGGGFGEILGQAITAVLPGFASGGSMRLGGRGGTDRNTLSLNGAPIARVSAGEVLSVTNPALTSGRGGYGGNTQVIQVDARGAVMNDQFAAMILSQAKAYSAEAGARSYEQSMKDAPARLQGFRRYGR